MEKSEGLVARKAEDLLQKLRAFAETIPADKLDMVKVYGPCRCVIGHLKTEGLEDDLGEAALSEVLTSREVNYLFNHPSACKPYRARKGKRAKAEFLRRLSEIEQNQAP